MSNPKISGIALLVYGLAIVLANVMIRTVGTLVLSDGTHLLPVGFGLYAPSGVFAAGLVLVARDVVQRFAGRGWSLVIILPGALITALFDVHLALASATAFFFSELVDYLVYTPLQQRGFTRAVFASALLAAAVDSFLFLSIAGIPLALTFPGQMLGKAEVVLVTAPLIWLVRRALPTPQKEVPHEVLLHY